MKLNVYAFGSALVDIQLHVMDNVFPELGIEKGNMYLTERTRQEEIIRHLLGTSFQLDNPAEDIKTAPGGSAANTVHGICSLGGTAGLCGKVADDPLGAFYISRMATCGVEFNSTPGPGVTGSCVVLISDDAQRTMLTCLGTSSEIAYCDAREDLLSNSNYLYLEGYLFDSPLATETMLRAIDTARKNNVKVALTASDSFCVQRHKEIMLKLLHGAIDLLFANAQEAHALSDTETIDDALRVLSGMCKNIALTDGAHGSVLQFAENRLEVEPFMISAIDTTGAGDAYAAGLLYGITNGYSLADSGRIASFYSSRIVSQLGPRYSGNIVQELKSLRLNA